MSYIRGLAIILMLTEHKQHIPAIHHFQSYLVHFGVWIKSRHCGRTSAKDKENTSVQVLYLLHLNSLAPGIFQFNFRQVIFKLILVNGGWGISYEIALRWMPLDLTVFKCLTDDKSTLVLGMAWCRQATSHYLSQCWPRSMSLNGVTRPQWVKAHFDSNFTEICS